MANLRLRLLLRSVEVEVGVDLRRCGDACLIEPKGLTGALPAGMGQPTGAGFSNRQLVLRTDRNTLLKHRKHSGNEESEFFGMRYRFDAGKQKDAFDRMRSAPPGHVSIPLRECACSYEVEWIPGRLPCPRSSVLSAHLASKYPVHRFRDLGEAEQFLERAWAALGGLHRMGVRHGDPAFYNFLLDDGSVGLIDLDDTMYVEENASTWDTGVFILHAMVPVLSDFLPMADVVGRVHRLVPDLPGPARSLLGLAISNGAKYNEAAKSFAELALQRQAERLYTEDLAGTQVHGGRLRELEAMAAERLDAIRDMDAAVRAIRAESEQRAEGMRKLTGMLAVRDQRIEDLEKTAAERLRALQAMDAAIQDVRGEAEKRAANLEEMSSILQARDRRIEELEAVASERLRGLEDTDSALRALRIEAEKRAEGLEDLTAAIAQRDRRIDGLEMVASERLDALEQTDAALRALRIEAEKRAAGLEVLTGAIALRDRRAEELEAMAGERLRALEETDAALRAARTEAERLGAEMESRDRISRELARKAEAERDNAREQAARLLEELERSQSNVTALKNESIRQFLLRRKFGRAAGGKT